MSLLIYIAPLTCCIYHACISHCFSPGGLYPPPCWRELWLMMKPGIPWDQEDHPWWGNSREWIGTWLKKLVLTPGKSYIEDSKSSCRTSRHCIRNAHTHALVFINPQHMRQRVTVVVLCVCVSVCLLSSYIPHLYIENQVSLGFYTDFNVCIVWISFYSEVL